jgi:RNA polymerase-binding transcription factor DksA
MTHRQSGKKLQRFRERKLKKYSALELREFKEIILGLREAAVDDVKSLRENLTSPLTDNDTGVADQEVGFVERSVHTSFLEENTGLVERQLQLISNLDAALKRINSGNYGTCKTCGRTIDRLRLLAVPHTQECVACKNARTVPPLRVRQTY